MRALPAYLDHLVELGLLDRPAVTPLPRRLGGGLKMGMVGTTPATGRVLLVGDAAGHAALVSRPRAIAVVGRVLTAPLLGSALAGGWGIFWNELLDGAAPGGARRVATASTWFGRAVTARTEVSRWFSSTFDDPGHPGPGEMAQRAHVVQPGS